MVPQVHINGTSKSELVEELLKARHAVEKAAEALAEAAPNPRDYYHTGNFKEAQKEYTARLETLHTLADTLYQEAMAIDGQ